MDDSINSYLEDVLKVLLLVAQDSRYLLKHPLTFPLYMPYLENNTPDV
jgi:hypothetical protein